MNEILQIIFGAEMAWLKVLQNFHRNIYTERANHKDIYRQIFM